MLAGCEYLFLLSHLEALLEELLVQVVELGVGAHFLGLFVCLFFGGLERVQFVCLLVLKIWGYNWLNDR